MERVSKGRRQLTVAAVILGFVAVSGWLDTSAVWAQTQVRETVKPVRIVQIYGRDTLEVGEAETFRVRVNAPYETAYKWQISDGTELGGNPIVYRFDAPGRYSLVATVRNPKGTDMDTLEVVVIGKRPPPPLASERKPSKVEERKESKPAGNAKVGHKEESKTVAVKTSGLKANATTNGQFTWVVATFFQRSSAEALANGFRAVGFRSSVIVDSSGKGSTVYRVTLGRFDSEKSALEAKAEVQSNGVKNPLLHRISGA